MPNWVRGRGLAVYLTVFNGALAGGSLAWGATAQRLGLVAALVVAAALLALGALMTRRWPLPAGEDVLDPAHAWPEPTLAARQLRDFAYLAESSDNITVLVMHAEPQPARGAGSVADPH